MGGGPSSSSTGGGGVSGSVSTPVYFKQTHKSILAGLGDEPYDQNDGGIMLEIEEALEANPYATGAAYDPDADLALTQITHDAADTVITALNEQTDWNAFRVQAETKLDRLDDLDWTKFLEIGENAVALEARFSWETLLGRADAELDLSEDLNWAKLLETANKEQDFEGGFDYLSMLNDANAVARRIVNDEGEIGAATEAFDASLSAAVASGRCRFRASLGDLGSLNVSAFAVGEALLEDLHNGRVDRFATGLQTAAWEKRIDFTLQAMGQWIQMVIEKFRLMQQAARFISQIGIDRVQRAVAAVASVSDAEKTKLQFLIDSVRGQMAVQQVRSGTIDQNVAMMANQQSNRVRALLSIARLQTDVSRTKIIAKREHLDRDIDIDIQAQLWGTQLYQLAGNLLATGLGGQSVYRSRTEEHSKNNVDPGTAGEVGQWIEAIGAIAGIVAVL